MALKRDSMEIEGEEDPQGDSGWRTRLNTMLGRSPGGTKDPKAKKVDESMIESVLKDAIKEIGPTNLAAQLAAAGATPSTGSSTPPPGKPKGAKGKGKGGGGRVLYKGSSKNRRNGRNKWDT